MALIILIVAFTLLFTACIVGKMGWTANRTRIKIGIVLYLTALCLFISNFIWFL